MTRLFVALELADEPRRRLEEAVTPLRAANPDLRWTPPEQWHLTLAFLGEVEEPAEDVAAAVSAAAVGVPREIGLRLGGPGRFGDRVLWVAVDDDPPGAVAGLGAVTQDAIAEAGLPVDEKPVRPHVTLARGRRGAKVRPALVADVPPVDGAWTVREILVYASVPAGRGRPNRYEVLARVPLGRR